MRMSKDKKKRIQCECGSRKISTVKGGDLRCARCGTYIKDTRPEWDKERDF